MLPKMFWVIKNHLRRKCGKLQNLINQKISLIEEIYKVKTWK